MTPKPTSTFPASAGNRSSRSSHAAVSGPFMTAPVSCSPRPWRSGLLVVVVTMLVAGLAACGAGSRNASSTTTTSPGSSTTTSTPSSSTREPTLFLQLKRFAECVRAQGITDFPDPTIGANGQPTFASQPPPTSQVQAATQACHQYTPAANGYTGGGQAGSAGNGS